MCCFQRFMVILIQTPQECQITTEMLGTYLPQLSLELNWINQFTFFKSFLLSSKYCSFSDIVTTCRVNKTLKYRISSFLSVGFHQHDQSFLNSRSNNKTFFLTSYYITPNKTRLLVCRSIQKTNKFVPKTVQPYEDFQQRFNSFETKVLG